jgi:hypothetical protein
VHSTSTDNSDAFHDVARKLKKRNENDNLTAAERKKIERKKGNQKKEEAFSFLTDPLDVSVAKPPFISINPRSERWKSAFGFEL